MSIREKTRQMIDDLGIQAATLYLYSLYIQSRDLTDDFNEWATTDPMAREITKELFVGSPFEDDVRSSLGTKM